MNALLGYVARGGVRLRAVGPGKMLIGKLIGWGGAENPLGCNAIGLPVTRWISGGAHMVWTVTWTSLRLTLLLSSLSLCLYEQIGGMMRFRMCM
jgi:hypothetical protein